MSFLYFLFFFFFNDTATTEIYTLSLHDALPISVMSYVEAGAGIGVVTESVVPRTPELRFVLLKPVQSVPLVLVWQEDEDAPPLQRFRELLGEWKTTGKLRNRG